MSSSAATVAAPAARCGARLAPKASGKTSRPRARAFARDEPVRRRATFRGASFRLRAADADDAPAEKTSTTPQKTSSDKTYRPPERDTGIAREADIGIDFEAEEKNEVDADGNTYFLKTGMDRGDAAIAAAGPSRAEARKTPRGSRETHWEKTDASGYKELGAEKSGFNEEGDTWWETWKECYVTDADGAGVPRATRRSSEARISGPETPRGRSGTRMVSDTLRAGAWSAAWRSPVGRESRRGGRRAGGATRRTRRRDHQVDGQVGGERRGPRWGDKWEERFASDGGGKKVGETWRVGANDERWSRTWGENIRRRRRDPQVRSEHQRGAVGHHRLEPRRGAAVLRPAAGVRMGGGAEGLRKTFGD